MKETLQKLIAEGEVQHIEEPTEWVNSLVIVEKQNRELRLCIDPRDLNKWIRREHYRLPTKSDITSTMAGACYFSKLDAASGFYQIVLDEESAKLCTFNMPFGISSAPEVFHRTVQQLFDGMDGVGVFLDHVFPSPVKLTFWRYKVLFRQQRNVTQLRAHGSLLF